MEQKDKKDHANADLLFLPIGALAQSLGVHQRTLRIYDKEGILSPKRNTGNRRSYSLNDLEKAKLILYLTRNLALNLAGVKIIIAMLEKSNIKTEDYLTYIQKIAKKANILSKEQENNIKKTAKRGRKPKDLDK